MDISTGSLFLHSLLLVHSHSLSFLRPSRSISLFHLPRNLSTLSHASAHSHRPNPFADFATANFNFSSTEISRIIKLNPALKRHKTLKNVERVVDMLKKYGCTHQQIALIMKIRPICLSSCPEKVIEPKILLLRDLGIHDEDLAKVVTRSPRILNVSLQRTLIPNATFLQDIFKRRDLLIKAILRKPSILIYDLEKCLKPSVAFFEECGFVGEQLSKFILSRPGLLLCTCLTTAKANFLQKIGVDKGSKMYRHVLSIVVVSQLETLEAKIENLQRCGLTVEEAINLIRFRPLVFNFSLERIQQTWSLLLMIWSFLQILC